MLPPGPDVISDSNNLLSFNGALMACAGRILVWWDRDFDDGGRPIRSDVRSAAREVWEQACQQTMATVADQGPAAELMENAVAQVSRYLNRIRAPYSPRKHGLVMVAFRRSLQRYAARLSRIELVGSTEELSRHASSDRWIAQAEARFELEGIVRKLSTRNADILMLRATGYEWNEIAALFGGSVSAIRNSFWREIDGLRWNSSSSDACSVNENFRFGLYKAIKAGRWSLRNWL